MAAQLPLAQQKQFEKLTREFDGGQYNKALRFADTILSVAPDHPDTLSMKGLTLHKLEKSQEAFELIKKAISIDIKSTTAWHCLGSCHVAEKQYPEALKAFKQALLTDPQNYTILRDISSVAVQVRDWHQFLDARQRIIVLKPSVRANWLALSCAHKMMGNPKFASVILESMPQINDSQDATEASECLLYQCELLLEQGDASGALDVLKRNDAKIKDRVAKLSLRAQAHAAQGQKNDAIQRYMSLIEIGVGEGDCIAKIARLQKIQLDQYLRPKNNVEAYMTLLDSVIQKCPKSDYAKRHALDCTPIESFRERFSKYTSGYVCRMVPSVGSILKSLYRYPDRVAIVQEVLETWEKELLAGNTSSFGRENPCYILWVWMLLATHWRRMRNFELAHQFIDKAIEHTPTLELLYLEKCKIYAKEGKSKEAADYGFKAQELDHQDKYLNSKAAKMFFRNNDIEQGEQMMRLFYKPGTPIEEVFLISLESQCYWYEKEVGEAFFRRGDVYSALQNLLMFEFHHTNNHNELCDFHPYVFRRATMRYWFDVIQRDDNIGENKFFLKMCPCIVQCYMRVHELGEDAVRSAHQPRPVGGETPEEVSRISQLRKTYYLEDIDLSEPMKKGEKYLNLLLQHRGTLPETQLLAINFYTMLKKPLLVARALHALKKLDCCPSLQEEVDKFKNGLLKAERDNLDTKVLTVVDEIMQSFIN